MCSHLWIKIFQFNQISILTYTPRTHQHSPPTTKSTPLLHLIQIQFIINFELKTEMNCLDADQLYRENQRLKQKVNEQQTTHQCLTGDLQTQFQIVNRQKNQIQELKHEILQLRKRKEEDFVERGNLEYRSARVIEGLEEQVDQYKRKYQKLENKIAPLIDHDTVRLKVLTEVEGNHQLEINILKTKISELKDETLRYRRQNQILKHSLQNQKMDRQSQINRIKSQQNTQFASDTIDYLTFSMWKDMEARLKSNYDNAKKEAQFYKQKYFASEKKYHARIGSERQVVLS